MKDKGASMCSIWKMEHIVSGNGERWDNEVKVVNTIQHKNTPCQ